MSLFRKPKPEISRAEALRCIPVVNPEVRVEHLTDGLVRLSYPLRARPMIEALIKKLGRTDQPPIKKLDLDEIGTLVWNLMDGRRSVKKLAEALADKYQLHPKEAEVSVTAFIRELGRRGLVALK